jgi:hypothetical protein
MCYNTHPLLLTIEIKNFSRFGDNVLFVLVETDST